MIRKILAINGGGVEDDTGDEYSYYEKRLN